MEGLIISPDDRKGFERLCMALNDGALDAICGGKCEDAKGLMQERAST
jgi:hypothetical protein